MAGLSNFGQQFADKVLRRAFQNAVVDAVVNRDYEGDIKKPGDRVNILSFLNEAEIGDYSVGTDMTVARVVDAQDQLIVEKRKYYNFTLDKLEELFTYAGDIPDALIELHAQKLAAVVDAYVLEACAVGVKAGHIVGTNFLVVGAANTMASLTTTSTGGTLSIAMDTTIIEGSLPTGSTENPLDGTVYFGGFQTTDLYKGVRMLSTRALVSPWWRITSITDSATVAITEWDAATAGPDFAEGYTLRGVFGGDGVTFPRYDNTSATGDAAWTTGSGFGWEVQGAIATALSASSVYAQVVLLNQFLDEDEIPAEGRTLVLPPFGINALRRAAELAPSGVGEIYSGTILNGKVGRIGSLDVLAAAGARVSTRASRSTATGAGSSTVTTTGTTGYQCIASHRGFCTFADKWTESRVVDQINQFARNYQGLFLFGALVPALRRKRGATLLGSQ